MHHFHDHRVAVIAAVARALGARMEDTGEQQGSETPDGQPEKESQAGQQPQKSPGDSLEEWKAHAKKWEKTARENRAAAKELEELKASQMTEQQKLEARATEAERKAAEAEAKGNRAVVALAKGLPAHLADRLRGDTVEELSADADELLKLVPANGGQAPPPPDLRQGQRGGQQPQTGDAWLRGMAAGRRKSRQ